MVALAEELAAWTRDQITSRRLKGIQLLGPAPCPIERLRTKWRWHFLLRAESAPTLGTVLRYLNRTHEQRGSSLTIEIDRDPESLL